MKKHVDLPVLQSFTDWDSVGLVKQALLDMEYGNFLGASTLIDAMGRDDRLRGVMATRTNTLLGLPVEFQASASKASQPKATERIRKDLADRGLWEQMFPRDQVTQLMKWGIMLGVGVGQKLRDGNAWQPTLKVWHPMYLYWRWNTRTYWISTMDGPVEIQPDDPDWILYTPHGYQRGWIEGLVRSLAIPWLIRQWAYRDWARYSEKHGLPIIQAIVPAGASDPDTERFLQEVSALGTESVVRTKQAPDGNKYAIELVEAMSTNSSVFKELIQEVNSSIAITLLGQNLTTEAGRGQGGAYAAAKIHDRVRSDLLAFDSGSLGQTLRNQGLKAWAKWNYGDEELAPTPVWQTDPPEDTNQKADAMQKLGTGLQQLQAAGMNVDLLAVAEEYSIPLDAVKPLLEPEERPEPPAAGDDDPPTDDEPKDDKPGDGTEKDQRSLLARRRSRAPGHVRGQLFADGLVDGGVGKAGRVLRLDLRAVLDVVEKAKSYEDLRSRLVQTFGRMRPNELAKLMERALVLAELRGHQAVLEDV